MEVLNHRAQGLWTLYKVIVEVLTLQEVEVPRKLLVLTVQHLQGVADLLQVLLWPAQPLKHKDTSSEYSSG